MAATQASLVQEKPSLYFVPGKWLRCLQLQIICRHHVLPRRLVRSERCRRCLYLDELQGTGLRL